MSTNLYRIVYVSSGRGVATQQTLDAILTTARRENAACNVSGLLLYHDGSFFQVLEGPEAAVRSIYERIALDRRHMGLVTLESRAVTERSFPDWSMGYMGADALNAEQRRGLVDLAAFVDGGRDVQLTGDKKVGLHIDSFLNTFREFAV